MIAFRAPNDVDTMLEEARTITGCDRTKLILETLKEFLPSVVLRLADEHRQKMEQTRAAFFEKRQITPLPAQAASTPESVTAKPESSSRGRLSNQPKTHTARKPRKFGKG